MIRTFDSGLCAAAVVLVGMLAGCAPPVVDTGTAFPAAPRLTHGEIAGVVMSVNNGEIETSRVALNRSRSTPVREFAQRMITDHTAINQRLQAMGVAPMENGTTQQLRSLTQQSVQRLEQYEGAALDRAYIDQQIELHEYTLNVLDNTLIPSATTSQMRAELQQTRSIIQAHLTHARQVRQGL